MNTDTDTDADPVTDTDTDTYTDTDTNALSCSKKRFYCFSMVFFVGLLESQKRKNH